MKNNSTGEISTTRIGDGDPLHSKASHRHTRWKLMPVALVLALLGGCQSPKYSPNNAGERLASRAEAITLREGDVLRISFPGSPNLDTLPITVRQDGIIALPLVGEVKVAGMTPAELEKDLVKRYSSELVASKVLVTVVSSSYVVYVSGAVLRPGKIASGHPISALEAIMEAGGFDYTKANLKAVIVVRHEGGQTTKHVLNLKSELNRKEVKSEPFYLRPSDIVYVPERFSWF